MPPGRSGAIACENLKKGEDSRALWQILASRGNAESGLHHPRGVRTIFPFAPPGRRA
jgi:hypothetical protein